MSLFSSLGVVAGKPPPPAPPPPTSAAWRDGFGVDGLLPDAAPDDPAAGRWMLLQTATTSDSELLRKAAGALVVPPVGTSKPQLYRVSLDLPPDQAVAWTGNMRVSTGSLGAVLRLTWRARDDWDGYVFSLKPGDPTAYAGVRRVVGGVWSASLFSSSALGKTLATDTIEARVTGVGAGTRLAIFRNGVEVKATLDSTPIAAGTTGLYANGYYLSGATIETYEARAL